MVKDKSLENPARVFISYAREDFDIAYKLYCDLKENGINPWLDKKEILPGQNWKFEIRKAIKECNYFIALLSSNSISKKGYVQKELKIAFDIFDEYPAGGNFIIPIRLDECEPVEERLQELHRADIFPSYDECFNQVMRVLKPISHEVEVKADIRKKFSDYPYAEFDILIVDPNENWVKIYLTILGESFRCDVALSHQEAITRLKYYKYKVICGEFYFPQPSDGLSLFSFVSKNYSEIPVVIITGGFLNMSAVHKEFPNVADVMFKGSELIIADLQNAISKLIEST